MAVSGTTLHVPALISARGDAMQGAAKVKVLFIAGCGPIVRDTGESRKLYLDVLGIPFKLHFPRFSCNSL
jgi:hypothetical protein